MKQCGTSVPTSADIYSISPRPSSEYVRMTFTIPLQTVVPTGTVQLHFLEAPGLQLESSWGGKATLLASQLDNVEIVFINCASTTPVDCSDVVARANGVHFRASHVAGAFHGAEYIKFMAALFNKEIDATELFSGANLHTTLHRRPPLR